MADIPTIAGAPPPPPRAARQATRTQSKRQGKRASLAANLERKLELSPNVLKTGPSAYCDNVVKTSRYTALNFVPLNLWEQLTQPSNFYFLIIGVLQAIPETSTTRGIPTIALPLSFILVVSGLRAALEDYARHKADRQENGRLYQVFDGEQFVTRPSADIAVGNVVRVAGNQPIPADMVCLHSANKRGYAFVETSSLDGETDLKPKSALAATQTVFNSDAALRNFRGRIMWEEPNKKLESFRGYLSGDYVPDEYVAIEVESVLLRGTVLKNTEFVLGLVVYTGEDTKIRCNVKQERKRLLKSSVMRKVDEMLFAMVGVQFVLCVFASVMSGAFLSRSNARNQHTYLAFDDPAALEGFTRFFTWFIILAQLVPISLPVSSEIVKTLQAYFISQDVTIYDPVTNNPTVVRSSVINEDLGQVSYIFSDKTGTLTQNKMLFRVAVVQDVVYGSTETEISRRVQARVAALRAHSEGDRARSDGSNAPLSQQRPQPHEQRDELPPREPWTNLAERVSKVRDEHGSEEPFTFDRRDEMLELLWRGRVSAALGPDVKEGEPALERHCVAVRRFLTHLALSNTINPIFDDKTQRFVFQASSPDELALCKFAQYMGFELVGRNPTLLRVNKQGRGETEQEEYKHLATLAFNSKRKRVTLVYQHGNKVVLMMKGADSSLLPLIRDVEHTERLRAQLVQMALSGLRTLVLGHAEKPLEWWENKWKAHFEVASSLPERGAEANHSKGSCAEDCRICAAMYDIESAAEVELVGATAIEDKLQDLVPEAIEDFLAAGVKVWMLTGDKRETAKNIGLACNLIDPDMENLQEWRSNRLVEVTGSWSKMMLNKEELRALFDALDGNGDGRIDLHELLDYCRSSTMPLFKEIVTVADIEGLFRYVDTDYDNFIQFEEFVDLMESTNITMAEAVYADIVQGMTVARAHDRAKFPVSMVVEGDAFSALYPPESGTRAAQREKKRLEEERRRRERRRVARIRRAQASLVRMHTTPPGVIVERAESDALSTRMSAGSVESIALGDPERVPKQFGEHHLEEVRDMFFALASMCKSVICCRLTPFQKAKIVSEIRARKGCVTLAVGDGANDEAMILEADVGVGIAGLEGTAASRASSFAIGQFRFLHTLLFVHGGWCYRRITTLVPFIFYKAAMVVLAMFWFGFFSQFSGQQYFNDIIYLFYNVAFTATPVLVLGVFERALPRATLENFPRLYASIAGSELFNPRVFLGWIFRAFLHSVIAFFFVLGALSDDIAPDGSNRGIWYASTLTFLAIIVIANLRILLEFRSITLLHAGFVAISVFGPFLIVWLLSLSVRLNSDLFGVVGRLYADDEAWMALFFTVTTVMALDLVPLAFQIEFRPTLTDVMRERERLSEEQLGFLPPADIKPRRELLAHQRTLLERDAAAQAEMVLLAASPKPGLIGKADAAGVRKAPPSSRLDVIMANVMRSRHLSGAFVQNSMTHLALALDVSQKHGAAGPPAEQQQWDSRMRAPTEDLVGESDDEDLDADETPPPAAAARAVTGELDMDEKVP